MAATTELKIRRRIRRKKHIRKVVHGTPERPRLVVFRSLRQVYVQLVDDVHGKTLTSISSLSPDVREKVAGKKPVEVGRIVGEACAKKAIEHEIRRVVFDRNGFPYHGRVKAVAEGARKGGLQL
ncbi:50S ribosomal protein L18 [bacterium]|nr:50S ribosomal protein L18 [bacterium]MBU1984427.1 50S ribosomal protein L18 [bacterium]